MGEDKPKTMRAVIDRIWYAIFDDHGIIKRLDKQEEHINMIEKVIEDYINVEKDFKIKFLEDREDNRKKKFWKIIGIIINLSGWAAFILALYINVKP